MPIRLTDRLIYPNRGTVTGALAYAVTVQAKRQVFLAEYLDELYRLCAKYQLDFAIAVAQSANETDSWRSPIWQQYGNPAGIGVTGSDVEAGPNLSLVYERGADAARAHVVHLYAYVRGPIPTRTELHDYISLDPRYRAVFDAGFGGVIRTVGDFDVNGRWATLLKPPPYGQRIVTSGQAVWPGLPDQDDPPVTVPSTPEEPVVSIPQRLDYSSLPFPVEVKFIPVGQIRQRTGIPMVPKWTTWHDTGNTNIGARSDMHHTWMLGGCQGPDGPTYTSWHFTVDDRKAIQHIPLNEVAWHAGDSDGPGNYTSLAIEECVNSDRNADQTRRNAAMLHALLIRELGLQGGKVEALVQHNKWSGKNCPATIRNQNLWASVYTMVRNYIGTTPTPPPNPTYAKPDKPPTGTHIRNDRLFLAVDEEYTLTRDETPRIYADRNSAPTGPTLKKGTKVKVTHVVSDIGESSDLTLVLVDGSRIDAKATV